MSSVPFVGIQCTSLAGPPYVFQGCTGDTGGQSFPFSPTGNGPWTITWYSHRTTVVTADPTPAVAPTPGAIPCAGQVDVQYKVISGYVDGGPLPGVLHASVCVSALSLQPGTVLTIS